ncbi:uncharacterized protein C2845_PM13G07650 [Panicum miliaceum]|uniref:Uncharacterized protein n=1 Tax=Panicum miliaceum TaxID=4540 RepID=A0A3L6RI84_PANMI|nr:uncharacterized protein C2845_PM13G07650 [Panicum miliaceum]
MRELHRWYLKESRDGTIMFAARIKNEHFHLGPDDVWIEFEIPWFLYHQDALDKSLLSIFCMSKVQECRRRGYYNVGFMDPHVIHEKSNQQGAPQGTISKAQVAAHDKATSHKRSKYTPPPPFKVGSIVILKSGIYPNKAIVPYATILSSSPKANVGGVELENQFYKVCITINHPIIQDGPLVRPMTGYNISGDAHAKGAPIAWPFKFCML